MPNTLPYYEGQPIPPGYKVVWVPIGPHQGWGAQGGMERKLVKIQNGGYKKSHRRRRSSRKHRRTLRY
jgi:hypothetical protein